MERSNGQDRQAEVTVSEWEQRKAFVGFTDDDAQLLRDLRPIGEAYADEVVEDLYRQFFRFEETRAFFPDDATLNRVKAMQKQYFLGLTHRGLRRSLSGQPSAYRPRASAYRPVTALVHRGVFDLHAVGDSPSDGRLWVRPDKGAAHVSGAAQAH